MGNAGRRQFLIASGALLAAPMRAISLEPEKVWRIGYVHLRSGPSERDEAFRAALRRLGYVEGRSQGAVAALPHAPSLRAAMIAARQSHW